MSGNRLILIDGQEGAGKSTTVRALAPQIPWSARIDAEDLSYVNPWSLDEPALNLLWRNVADLATNYWVAGFRNFVGASFVSNLDQYNQFCAYLDAEVDAYVIQLCASKAVRDRRRIERPKSSTKEWRDHVDQVDPEDFTIAAGDGQYRFLRIDNDDLTVDDTIRIIRNWAPELFT